MEKENLIKSKLPSIPYQDLEDDPVEKFIKRPVLVSLTATCNFDEILDLKKIGLRLRNASYNPSAINQCVIRFLEPRVTVMLCSNGKASALGAKSIEEAAEALLNTETLLNLIGYHAQLKDFQIVNTTSHAALPFPIHTDSLLYHHAAFCTQETQIFSSVLYKMTNPRATIHIFANGRLVISGKLTAEEIDEVFDLLAPVLHEFSENRLEKEASKNLPGNFAAEKIDEIEENSRKIEENQEIEEDDDFENMFLSE